MRIRKIQLQNFKRFTDLTISDIPDSSKLVLLIGSNGSGKSSVFDAFDWLSKGVAHNGQWKNRLSGGEAQSYYRKNANISAGVKVELSDGRLVQKEEERITEGQELVFRFLGRSSIRIVPRISNAANPAQVLADADSPTTYIENDTRFTNDVFLYIQQINNALREPVFSGKQADTLKIFKDFIEPLNTSLLNIFGGDEAVTIQIAEFQDATPSTTAKLIFKKGSSKVNYDLLSHGEKQVIILLINFIVRQEYYKNSIIFIDEMDCHLNTALQHKLIDEIVTRWIPDDAQLWTASHALGFIDYAKRSEHASIVDLDLLNFDSKQQLMPLAKDSSEVYEIAIPKATIASILKDYKLVVVENKNAEHFNAALGQSGYLFLPANNNREVFLTAKGDDSKLGLRDRDYLKPEEVAKIQEVLPNLKILSLYSFENYIYHPDNIAALNLPEFDRQAYIADITRQKNEQLLEIVAEVGTARSHYAEFKDVIKNDENIKPVIATLQSDKFEEFYACFNMKKYFNRSYLSKLNLTVSKLSQTGWFKNEILKILK